MAEFNFKIEEHICVLKEENDGWKKELNLISWCGNEAKYDIRSFSEDHSRLTRGITLSPSEMHRLVAAMATRV